ncbi:MAG: class I mannose-6-phosphate isomerase [Candidatus Zhuqueibacterota bacterium]
MTTQAEFESRIEALNQPALEASANQSVVTGWESIGRTFIRHYQNRPSGQTAPMRIALDGYVGNDWEWIAGQLSQAIRAQGMTVALVNVERAKKDAAEIEKRLAPILTDDSVFGKVYRAPLATFFDRRKLKEVKSELASLRKKTDPPVNFVICYGAGAAMPGLRRAFDMIVYVDLTRQEVLKRSRQWTQLAGKTQSISPKKLYYVDFQVNDRHRNELLERTDFYIDGNIQASPRMVSLPTFRAVTRAVASAPFRLKPIYEPGPWGGQWLKKIRQLPDAWVNCAWSFELIAQEMSLLVSVQNEILELPWTTFFHAEYDRVMGRVSRRRFRGEFPIRFDYLDTWDGGDLSIQVHPNTSYIQKHFNEPYHQGEMYYIVDAVEGTRVNLGVNEAIRKEDFHRAAKLADEAGVAFNYCDYVNSVPSKKHDLLLIPPGTVHGSGVGQVVLEISATTYRYTFKIYDHLRPDLNGVMRPIHVAHAFNVIKWFRRSNWVAQNLVPQPRLVRSGKGWAEYIIGDRREFFHVVFRLEFERDIDDDTRGQFHVLTLVEGQSVKIYAPDTPDVFFLCHYSETIIVPASMGKYRIANLGETPCKLVKARLR